MYAIPTTADSFYETVILSEISFIFSGCENYLKVFFFLQKHKNFRLTSLFKFTELTIFDHGHKIEVIYIS